MRRLGLLLCVLSACSFDGRVQGDAVVTCQGPADCPEGFFCQASIGRCIEVLSPALAPPSLLGPVVVSPTLAARGVPVRVLFQLDEALARPPVVRAVYSSGAAVTVPLLDEAPGVPSYAAELLPGAEATEGAVRFFADLVDEAGTEVKDLELGVALLDFSPPDIVRGSAGLTLTPSATSPLSRVEAMNEATLAQLTLSLTEPVAVAPELRADTDGGVQAFSVRYAGATGTSHLFALTLTSSAVPQGPVRLSLAVEDLAGNRATRPVELKAPGLVIDTEPPALTGLGDGGIVLRRAPTGAAFRLGTRGTSITGAPGVTEPATVIIASETPTSPDLARATASATGAFELSLPADLGGVTVRALDAAGNQSPAVLVRHVSWFASLSGSFPGLNNPNPHRALSTRVLGPTPEPPGATEHYGSSGLDSVGGASVLVTGAANWRRVWPGAPTTSPVGFPGTNRSIAVWDPFRARVVAIDASGSTLVTWEWNGAGWQRQEPTDPEGDGDPPGSTSLQSTVSLAFDEDTRLVLLVTGTTNQAQRATWGWDGRSWAQLASDGTTRCTGCALAWDSKRRRVLSYDPTTGTTAAWQHAARQWQAVAFATAPSLLAAGPSLAFERHTGRWLRFGGAPFHDETWAFDGTNWALLATGGPSPRWGALMGYEPVSRRVLLHGGNSDAGRRGDTWAWDGTRWELVADAGLQRSGGSLVIAPALGQTLLVGHGLTLRLQEDGGTTQVANGLSLEPRTGVAATYSPFHDAVLLSGGVNTNASPPLLRGVVQGLGPAGFFTLASLPEARQRGALAATPVDGRLYYLGGLGADAGPTASTFMTSDSGAWLTLDAGLRLPDGGVTPAPRTDQLAWVDPALGRLVMFGGREATGVSGALFTLGPSGWVDGGLRVPADFTGCAWGGAVLQAPDGGVQVSPGLGFTNGPGSCTLGTTYPTLSVLWSSTEGVLRPEQAGVTPSVALAPRAWDDVAGAWVRFGGVNVSSNGLDTGLPTLSAWWDTSWVTVPYADTDGDGSPGPRLRHGMGFVRGRRATVLFGGESSAKGLDDAWELQLSGTRPALLLRVRLQGALPRGAAPVSLHLEGVAGADDGDGGSPGVSAQLWHRQRWLDLGPAVARDGGALVGSAGLPGAFVLELDDSSLVAELLEEPTITLALVPTHGFQRSPPRLLVDALELRLDAIYPESSP